MSSILKRILLVCGSGIATSTVVDIRLSKLLDDYGFKGKYQVHKCSIDLIEDLVENYDFIIGTVKIPTYINCPFIDGIPFLTGENKNETISEIINLMNK